MVLLVPAAADLPVGAQKNKRWSQSKCSCLRQVHCLRHQMLGRWHFFLGPAQKESGGPGPGLETSPSYDQFMPSYDLVLVYHLVIIILDHSGTAGAFLRFFFGASGDSWF